MKTSKRLEEMNACGDAVDWVGRRGIMTAWRDCNRADWMIWVSGKLNIDKKLIVLAACDCAETALKYVPKGEDRPAKAIRTARNWCNSTATKQECRAAAAAAYAASAAAAATYAAAAATYAADAAAATYAAAAAAYAASAAYAATDAAAAYAAYAAAATYAAATYAAKQSTQKLCADLVRKRIPFNLIKEAWNEG